MSGRRTGRSGGSGGGTGGRGRGGGYQQQSPSHSSSASCYGGGGYSGGVAGNRGGRGDAGSYGGGRGRGDVGYYGGGGGRGDGGYYGGGGGRGDGSYYGGGGRGRGAAYGGGPGRGDDVYSGRGRAGGRGDDVYGGRGRAGGRGDDGYGGRGRGVGRGDEGYGGRGRGRGRGGRRSAYVAPSLPKLTLAEWEAAGGSLNDDFRRLTLKERRLVQATRPGYGKIGVPCVVKANHFLVDVAHGGDVYHYDVAISPEVTSKKVCKTILSRLVQLYKASDLGNKMLAYDGMKSFYTAGPLPFTSKEFVIKLDGDDAKRRDSEFKVVIKLAAQVDMLKLKEFLSGGLAEASHETIQVLDIVLRSAKRVEEYTVVGRSFFSTSMGGDRMSNGLEYWRGYYQSLRPTQMGLSLNIDASARPFYEPVLLSDFVTEYFNRPLSVLSDQERLKVKKALKGITIETTHGRNTRRFKIVGISTEPANELMFFTPEEGEVSVARYFKRKYTIGLRYPSFPCVQVGNSKKPIYLPMEVCRIVVGQRYTKKLNESQVTDLLRATCQRPEQRENLIVQMAKDNNYEADELVNDEFGIHVSTKLTSVEARVLPPPTLKYNDETGRDLFVEPEVGQWNMIKKRMFEGGTVKNWTCIYFCSSSKGDMVEQFCRELVDMCASKGMNFDRTPAIKIGWRPGQIEDSLKDIHAQTAGTGRELDLLIIILPEVGGDSYGKIKRICETELGIISQCCRPKNVTKISKQYLENLSLKINVKVGGRNNALLDAHLRRIPLVTTKLTIIFGADVTHPPAGEDSSPSVAAVVASMDWPHIAKYTGLVSAQSHRVEIIQDLQSMVRELLLAFMREHKKGPDAIIFYRDGVGENQFAQVLLHEMTAIREACLSIRDEYLPRVTFVVVQKRHHTRLFPSDPKMADRSDNILPGTVIDTKISHRTEFDFYLCSHAGIQGTSRPTHYHVLFDENNFTADLLQLLTNSLCYTYARCTRSVSIVPPAYYAHLAAFRARYYMEGGGEGLESTSSTSASTSAGQTRDSNVQVRPLPSLSEKVKTKMFYC